MLSRDTIGLIESSKETLFSAIKNLGISKDYEFIVEASKYSAEIGLIGASVEQLIAACIVQAKGIKAITQEKSGHYKTFKNLISDFQKLIKDHILARSLYKGIKNIDEHQDNLNKYATRLRLLCTARAFGLHGGVGLTHEATVVQAVQASNFMELISKSDNFKPYLRYIPKCLLYKIDRTLILEDLAAKLNNANEEDKPALLASIYLVLPEIPENEPEWLKIFEKITIAPAENDLVYLTQVLSTALPATLIRASSKDGDFLPVTISSDNPNAIPISSFHLKRKHINLKDQWYADIANANGRIEDGVLDLPPQHTVAAVFGIGLDEAKIMAGQNFGPHESWPFIISSMNSSGTCGPYWFLVQKTDDLGQLKKQLLNAKKFASKKLILNINECIAGIELIQEKDIDISENLDSLYDIKRNIDEAQKKRKSIKNCIERSKGSHRELSDTLEKKLYECLNQENSNTKFYDGILHSKDDIPLKIKALNYWCRTLAEGAMYITEAASIVSILENKKLSQAHTASRKALRRIDFLEFGPKLP